MTPEEFCNLHIGKPWREAADGPEYFDCFGLVVESFRALDGIDLPSVSSYVPGYEKPELAAQAFGAWHHKRSQPCDGAVMVVRDQRGRSVHVGRCLLGGVLHSPDGSGVRHNKYRAIAATYPTVEYYMICQ